MRSQVSKENDCQWQAIAKILETLYDEPAAFAWTRN